MSLSANRCTDEEVVDSNPATPTVFAGQGAGPPTIVGTAHHPYWDDTTNAWTDADHLHAGDTLQTTDGDTVTVLALTNYTSQTIVTYNLTIDGTHTYYVEAGNTPVLVHNSGGTILPTQVSGRNTPLTKAEATELAKYLGYRPTNYRVKGQTIYTNGKTYISQDMGSGNGSHNGGTWKIASSVENLGSKSARTATTDALLNPIGC